MNGHRTTKHGTDVGAASTGGSGEESILRRWSRRKREAGERSREPVAAPQRRAEEAATDAAVEQPASEGAAELPPLESIDESSDVSGFFGPSVDEALRRLALRRLFHTAKFNVTDGLDVYVENYRNFEPLGDIVTADMRHHAERLARAAEQAAEAEQEARAAEPAEGSPAVAQESGDESTDDDSRGVEGDGDQERAGQA